MSGSIARPRFTIGRLMAVIAALAVPLAWLPTPPAAGAVLLILTGTWLRWSLRAWSIAFAVSLAGTLLLLSGAACWIGAKAVSLECRVVDARSGRPIAGAAIILFQDDPDRPVIRATADRVGVSRLMHRFRAIGTRGPLADRGSVHFRSWWLEVSAPGYHTRWSGLAGSVGASRDIHQPTPPPFTIALEPIAAGDGPLAEFAGDYFAYRGESGTMLALEADGSFAWEGYDELGVHERATGTARLGDGRLMLPASAPAELRPVVLIPVVWGPRMYLLHEGQVAGFRRDVERGVEPRFAPLGWYLLRGGDWDQEVNGEPDLPE